MNLSATNLTRNVFLNRELTESKKLCLHNQIMRIRLRLKNLKLLPSLPPTICRRPTVHAAFHKSTATPLTKVDPWRRASKPRMHPQRPTISHMNIPASRLTKLKSRITNRTISKLVLPNPILGINQHFPSNLALKKVLMKAVLVRCVEQPKLNRPE